MKHTKQGDAPLSILKNSLVRKYILLATKVEGLSNYCCAALTNNQLSLNKWGKFRTIDEFKHE